MSRTILKLECGIQHYAWGDTEFIPRLLGLDNADHQPCAELWMGAHPDLPAEAVLDDRRIPLNTLIEQDPDGLLGPEVARLFGGRLPYLFKVLSARAPLSIQTHPSKTAAEAGFAREDTAGVPRSAKHRNYRDDNHKPELIAALTDFFGLRGFRPLPEIAGIPREVPELAASMRDFRPTPAGLRRLYEELMSLPQEAVDTILAPLITRLRDADRERPWTRADRAYWVLEADRAYSADGHHDRGLFSIYLLNLVHLAPGEAMFLPAGVLHAYLEGSGMEIMANSNNVLRGGLTPKHVDVPELIANVTFEGGEAEIIRAVSIGADRTGIYTTTAREFELHRLEIDRGRPHENATAYGADVLIPVDADDDASITVTSGREQMTLPRGGVLLAPHGVTYTISAGAAVTIYRATVPRVTTGTETGRVDDAAASAPTFRGRRPTALAFGTSGLRGLVTDITDLEAYVNTRGFLEYLFAIEDIRPGDVVCIAGDRRPSTDSPERSIMRAVARAITDAGLTVENLGLIPTPALTFFALRKGCASVMITGSHIPFDRNGIKFNRTSGEVLKADEAGILDAVAQVRRREYARAEAESPFGDDGMFKPDEHRALPAVNDEARRVYLDRYLGFFPPRGLAGTRIVYFQHSAVGRDLFVELLEALGAEVHPAARSEAFIAIDTEDVSAELLGELQQMVDEVAAAHGPVDALLSTDGDSDRPLLCGVDAEGRLRFYGGDLLGIVVADFLDADAISVPISANDAVDLHFAGRGVHPIKTRIGSPHVIKSMQETQAGGGARVVGWEANGGFLLGSAIERDGRRLEPLPTRDAALPLLAALFASIGEGCALVDRFAKLPPRFSKAGLIDGFPLKTSHALVARLSVSDGDDVIEASFDDDRVMLRHADGRSEPAPEPTASARRALRDELKTYFTPAEGFGPVVRINTIDGVRLHFANGDIAHIRPSGNAPQLRMYACADTQTRSDAIVAMGIREPDGILRRLESSVDTS